jgi:hypothetical protein
MQQADMCRCDISCATDPTNSIDIVAEWGRGFTASLPLCDIHKPTPLFLRQRLDIVSCNFYDKIYYYSFHIGDICFHLS